MRLTRFLDDHANNVHARGLTSNEEMFSIIQRQGKGKGPKMIEDDFVFTKKKKLDD